MEETVMVVEEVAKANGNVKKVIIIGAALLVTGLAVVAVVKKIRKGKTLSVLTEGDKPEAVQAEGSN
jgi:hypothetical protein